MDKKLVQFGQPPRVPLEVIAPCDLTQQPEVPSLPVPSPATRGLLALYFLTAQHLAFGRCTSV